MCSDPEGTNSSSRSLFPNILSPTVEAVVAREERKGRRSGGLDTKSCGLNFPKRTIDIKRGDREKETRSRGSVWPIDRVAHRQSEKDGQCRESTY